MFAALQGDGDLFGKAYDSTFPHPFGSERPGAQKMSECDRAWSRNAVVYLNSLTDRPWAGWNHGKGISTAQLAAKISDYGIKSADVGIGNTHAKGYHAHMINDAFSRYLASVDSDDSNKG